MNSQRLQRDKARVDTAFAQIAHLPKEPEVQAHFARYLCVILSGFIENSVETVCLEYTQRRSQKSIQKYVSHKLEKFQNPKLEKILELLSEFDPKMSDKLRTELPEEIAEAIDSVVSLRHVIAHGGATGATLATIKGYYVLVMKFADHLEKACL